MKKIHRIDRSDIGNESMKNIQRLAFRVQRLVFKKKTAYPDSFSLYAKHHPLNTVRGFSLIELLVVMSIFTIITTVVLANHSRFNGSVLLGSLAYDIGLSVREAQVYGLSVRQFASQFDIGYGVHFADSGAYVFFADLNTNNRYDGEPADSVIRNYAVGRGHTIVRYCAETAAGVEHCSDALSPDDIAYLDIVFFRPDPDAVITTNKPTTYSRGKVVVSSPAGETRTVTIASTGQISVTNP